MKRWFCGLGRIASAGDFVSCLSVSGAVAHEESIGGAHQSGAVEKIIVTTRLLAESLQTVALAVYGVVIASDEVMKADTRHLREHWPTLMAVTV